MYRKFAERLDLMLTRDDAAFENWNPNETADADRYDLADPAAVATEVRTAGDALAAAFDAVRPDQLARTGRRSDGATFTVTTFARYQIHDPVHHLWDVTGERVDGAPT